MVYVQLVSIQSDARTGPDARWNVSLPLQWQARLPLHGLQYFLGIHRCVGHFPVQGTFHGYTGRRQTYSSALWRVVHALSQQQWNLAPPGKLRKIVFPSGATSQPITMEAGATGVIICEKICQRRIIVSGLFCESSRVTAKSVL